MTSEPIIHIENVHKRFGNVHALRGVNLDVYKGEVIVIIGPSGSGKSTLLRCINRLVEPSAGAIRMGDEDLAKLRGRALRNARRRIGMVFQEYNLSLI
ncbi:MAG: ATP-binding cassette domain-containing protein, partial [Bellilinea sp.]|nr:ATP-binding cassette domain-containing protein [Bellilinea sp.]